MVLLADDWTDDWTAIDVTLTPYCLICGAGPKDGHWSSCPHSPETKLSDQDEDADDPETQASFLY